VSAARAANPSVRAARAGEAQAASRVAGARAAWLPRIDFAEAWQRGNMPVYVFGSLLSQRRFAEANFAVDALNHPDPLSNHRASLTVQHALFSSDVQTGVRLAGLDAQLATVDRETVEQDMAVEATRAFGEALVAQAGLEAARAAVAAAEEDLRRARDRRETGLVTEADVLSVEVHLASMRAQAIEADSGRRIAMATLNRIMGAPLDREYVLARAAPPPVEAVTLADLEAEALRARPDLSRAALGEQRAAAERSGARSAFLPQLGWQGGYEWNGQSFGDRAGGWMVGAEVRLNVFNGLGDRARAAAAGHALERARAEREAVEAAVRVDVSAAVLRLEAARARAGVSAAAVDQAHESQRILRDRYESGLVGISDVLRAAQAVLDAERQKTAADVDVVVGQAALDRAVGR
jgi:outer membrane protein TolC